MLKIRNATIEDFVSIFDLLVTLYDQNDITQNKTKELFITELKNEKTTQLVATNNNHIIGFVSASNRTDYQEQGTISILTCLIVDEKMRGQGIGTQLLQAMEKACKKKKSLELQFSSTFRRNKAHQFYTAQGYTKTAYYFWKQL